MRHKVKDVPKKRISEDECQHHWVIEVADGPTSRGVCKICGAKKEFINSMPDYTAPKRNKNVFSLPGLTDIDIDKEQNDS